MFIDKTIFKKVLIGTLLILLPIIIFLLFGLDTKTENFYKYGIPFSLLIAPFWRGILFGKIKNQKIYITILKMIIFIPIFTLIYQFVIALGVDYWREDKKQFLILFFFTFFVNYQFIRAGNSLGEANK